MRNSFNDPSELDGYDELKPQDKERVNKAWEDGHVADEDIPESAKKPAGEVSDEDDKPKKKKPSAKKDAEEVGEKPKGARAAKAKVSAAVNSYWS